MRKELCEVAIIYNRKGRREQVADEQQEAGMRVRILGCSGGIGLGLRTTSILLDDDIVIDMGTGVGDLSLTEQCRVRRVFLTHSHLDHTACLPLMLDTTFDNRVGDPLHVYALPETIAALREHMFNDVMWPDFESIPTPDEAVLKFIPINAGDVVTIDQRHIRAVNVHHAVPSLGYCIEANNKVFAFSGDTMTNHELWPVLNNYASLEALVVEVSFPDAQAELAETAKHYCPKTLAKDLRKLNHHPRIWVTAMKPGLQNQIFAEVLRAIPDRDIRHLKRGDVFDF